MTYGESLALVTNEALKQGVPAQEVILHLELISHELKSSFIANAAMAGQLPEAPIILPAPPGLNGGRR